MKKLTDFIVDKRYVVLIIFIGLSFLSLCLSKKVNINYDMAQYLPSTSETRLGKDIMEKEFPNTDESSLEVMFKGLDEDEKDSIYDYLITVNNVESVDYDDSDSYNKDDYTLYVINVSDNADSKAASDVYKEIKNHYEDYEVYMSGDIYNRNHPVLSNSIVFLAIFCAMIILIIMCESYVEPFPFLFAIGMAVFLNNGTNIIFSSVSNITSSISAILQMALSMDYSIMLINRYRQEREKDDDKVSAMKKALYNAFKSISSSSVTTIVGLIVLVFMSFTIGRDLGLVLAKGVLFSLVSIFCCLPGLILLFDNLINKTKKKTLNIKLDKLGKFSYKFRKLSLILLIVAFIGSFLLKGNLGIFYSENETNEVKEIFPENNQIAVIYKNEYEDVIEKYCKKLEENKKIDDVICYGNTINEELTYEQMNDKISSLGEDTQIDDYLLKIIYYNYYNSDESNKMSFDEFITFIKNEGYSNKEINDKIDSDTKNNIEKLENFVYDKEINKKRTAEDISKILDIDSNDVEDIFVYYESKNNTTRLTIDEFVSFMKNYVLTNDKYSAQINNNTVQSLDKLSKFTDKDLINQKMTSDEMSQLFGMDSDVVKNLYLYYASVNDVQLKLSINEFSSFVLSQADIDEETKDKMTTLNTFSNKDFINKNMNSSQLSNIFGVDEEIINQLLLLKYSNIGTDSKYSLSEFVSNVIYIKNNTSYLDDLDTSNLEELYVFTQIDNDKKLDKNSLSMIFDNQLVNMVYLYGGLPDNYEMTVTEFIDFTLNNFSSYLDDSSINNLKLIKIIVEDSTKYSSQELSNILNISLNDMNKIYSLIDFYNGDTSDWTITPYEAVNLIIDNKDNEIIKNNISEEELINLELLSNIMNSTLNNTKYSYQELSNLIGVDEKTVRNIYVLYESYDLKLTPNEFVDFILEHKNDELLKQNLTSDSLKELSLLQEVMNSVLNDKKYNSLELSKLLGIDKEQLDLIYSLYNMKIINTNKMMSLKEFIGFLVTDVIDYEKYSNKFDSNMKDTIKTINTVMEDSINHKRYSKDELYKILNKFTDDIDKDMVDLLYIYYGSYNNYDESWKLTVEEFISYLNNDILTDNRFDSFIEDDMRESIKESDKEVNDSKKLLVGEKYSRMILNTSYLLEDKETFDFVKSIRNDLNSEDKEIYVVGDSPMALDISLTFDRELNFITILTMLAIFIVVAITFKSIIIPTILVLIIQCAIYMIMGILSVAGESVYFIAILIVQSILMGATIDYAILYTSYYLENRKSMGVKDAVIASYNKSIHTILTSSSILIIVTLIVGSFAQAIAAKICRTLSQGTICSTLLILLLLPGILALFDKFIVKKKN